MLPKKESPQNDRNFQLDVLTASFCVRIYIYIYIYIYLFFSIVYDKISIRGHTANAPKACNMKGASVLKSWLLIIGKLIALQNCCITYI